MRCLILPLLLSIAPAWARGTLSDDIRITSELLGYDLQYRVYLPDGYEDRDGLPVLFVTDGPGYIDRGRMPALLDRLVARGRIEPVVTVFVDPRDPDDIKLNRRSRQFLCNPDYYRFFAEEFVPAIEDAYRVARVRTARTILGLSFGATNAACFALYGHETFYGIGMQSPANHPVPGLLRAYERQPMRPVKMFLSTGVPYDNTRANREFRGILKEKGYDLEYVEVEKDHDWDNWRPLLDDVLIHFFGTGRDH